MSPPSNGVLLSQTSVSGEGGEGYGWGPSEGGEGWGWGASEGGEG